MQMIRHDLVRSFHCFRVYYHLLFPLVCETLCIVLLCHFCFSHCTSPSLPLSLLFLSTFHLLCNFLNWFVCSQMWCSHASSSSVNAFLCKLTAYIIFAYMWLHMWACSELFNLTWHCCVPLPGPRMPKEKEQGERVPRMASKNAKEKSNSATLLAVRAKAQAEQEARGRSSHCSSEKDSGYSGMGQR